MFTKKIRFLNGEKIAVEDKRKASKKMKQKLAQCCDVELTFNF